VFWQRTKEKAFRSGTGMRMLLAYMATDLLSNPLLHIDKVHVKSLRSSVDAFSSFFKPNSIHNACSGKAFKVPIVVYGYKERIVLHINLRVGGNFPDKLLKTADMTERQAKFPGSIVEFDFAPSRMLRKRKDIHHVGVSEV
jgi:hypothetical protein